jgi:hypothetical protein
MDLSKLAAAANTTKEALEKIGYKAEGNRNNARLLGHEIRPHDLRLTAPQVCPECIKELEFIQAHFDLAVMVACPIHGVVLVSECPKRHPLTWLRPGLLECKCGAELTVFDRTPIDDALKDLLDIVRRKVLRLDVPEQHTSRIPAKHLSQLSLRSLLYVIETLGRRTPAGLISIRDNREIVSRASKVLSDWPHNFHHQLEEFQQGEWSKSGALLTKGGLRGFYMALMYGMEGEDEVSFLRDALSDFATSRRGPGRRSDKSSPEVATNDHELPKQHFAQRVGIDIRTLDRIIREGDLKVSRTAQGKRERIWIDPSVVNLRKKEPGRVYRASEAAKMLAVPKSVLIELKKSGAFAVTHLLSEMRGYHELDIAAFRLKVEDRARPTGELGQLIPFPKAVRNSHCTVEMKAEVVRRILEGEIPLFGRQGTPLQQLQVPRESIVSFVRMETARVVSNQAANSGEISSAHPLVIRDAARVLECSQKAIPLLVEQGHLEGTWKGNALWIDRRTLVHFHERYLRIASVAKSLSTSAEALVKTCRKGRIPLIACQLSGKDGIQSFILRKHQAKLRESHAQRGGQ